MGSWWGDSYPVYEPPGADAAERLDALERGTGAMPLSLRAWYQVVGTVNLIGSHPEWPETEVLDPLVVAPLGEMLEGIERDYREWREDQGGDVEWAADELEGPDAVPFRWDFAPDALHKANISGGAPYGVEFPCPCADARVWFEPHDTTFVNYLRECLRWGGFPGFAQVPASERPGEDLALLTDGLDPF